MRFTFFVKNVIQNAILLSKELFELKIVIQVSIIIVKERLVRY